jgi:hypothetical protein
VTPSPAHAELIATFKRAEADAAHKFGLIKAAEKKGPNAIQTAVETAAKTAKRSDSFAKKTGGPGGELERLNLLPCSFGETRATCHSDPALVREDGHASYLQGNGAS